MNSKFRSRLSPLSLIIIMFLIIAVAWLGWDVLFRGKAPAVVYEIMSIEDISSQEVTRGNIHVRVESTTPSLRELRGAALEVWSTRQQEWDQLNIFFYIPGMDVRETAYAVARFNQSGIESIRLVQNEPFEPEEEEIEPEATR